MISFIDYRSTEEEKESLLKLGVEILQIPKCTSVYEAINGHVDIQLNILNEKEKIVIINKDIHKEFKELLNNHNIRYIESSASLKNEYPGNVLLNAAILDDYIIHNFKFTDENILKNIDSKKLINVKQGYAKCSILPVREKAIITNDKGISNSLLKEDFDVLLLPPGDIILPGFNYGFIGGIGGKITPDILAFHGDLDCYIYGDQVKQFLKKYNVKPIYLKKGKLFDRGSIFTI